MRGMACFVSQLHVASSLRTALAGSGVALRTGRCELSTSRKRRAQSTRATLTRDESTSPSNATSSASSAFTTDQQANQDAATFQAAVDDALTSVYTANGSIPSPPAHATKVGGSSDGEAGGANRKPETDTPPLRYDRYELKKYWDARSFELNQRYLAFARRAAPFIASVLRHLATGTLREDAVISELAIQAREGMEELGPTYIKMGQLMSIRPDVIPQPAMDQLQKLQDNVKPFDNDIARRIIEEDIGKPLDEVFSEFSAEPIAAASLAQVYRARLRDSNVEVAVKVQREEALTLCSKDMYVLQRAIGVYQQIMRRWTAQKVDYDALLESFASGFYEELDFKNEARNQMQARRNVLNTTGGLVYVPKVYEEYTSRRVLVSEFVHGKKLTACDPKEIRRLTAVAQECFLRMLLDPEQSLHCDAHGGNQLAWDASATFAANPDFDMSAPPTKSWAAGEDGTLLELGLRPELCLIDFGLMESIPEADKPKIVLSVVHMASKDWEAVTDDMISLGFLPENVDRSRIVPLMGRLLTPYVLEGGGAAAFTKNGGYLDPSFRNLMRDLSAAQREIPFSIPSYWPIIGRGIAILEGIALAGDPSYRIVLEAYPFVARRLLEQNGGGVEQEQAFRDALTAILYPIGADGVRQPRPSGRRILALINSALAKQSTESTAMLNLDALPPADDTASVAEMLAFAGTNNAAALRRVLVDEAVVVGDLIVRSAARRAAAAVQNLTSVRLPGPSLPFLAPPRVPVLNPVNLIPAAMRAAALDRVAPPLTAEEDVYVTNVLEAGEELLGVDLRSLLAGAGDPQLLVTTLLNAARSARASTGGDSVGAELVEILAAGSGGSDTQQVRQAREALLSILSEVAQKLTAVAQQRLATTT